MTPFPQALADEIASILATDPHFIARCAGEATRAQCGPLPPACPIPPYDVPHEIRLAAFEVSNWFTLQGVKEWELGPIMSRRDR